MSDYFQVGLIGEGIQASLSPRLHEAEARTLGVRYGYHLIDLHRYEAGAAMLPRLLDAAELLGFAGLNITHPCKQAVIPLLDALSDEAAAIGAVNAVVFTGGRRVGQNTDWSGFAESFRRGLDGAALGCVLLLGAGGAGAAVGYAMMRLGVGRLLIYDRDAARAGELAGRLSKQFGPERAASVPDLPAAIVAANGLIQASPVGMIGHPGLPLPVELLRPELWLAEVIYFPLETELLKHARQIGCRTLDGGRMAVFQAVGAFRLFTGLEPDAERMLRHFAQMVGGS